MKYVDRQQTIAFLFYNFLASPIIWTILVPWHLALIVGRRFSWEKLSERLGKVPESPKAKSKRIIIHAVSAGEMVAAESVMSELLKSTPHLDIILTSGNRDGLQVARRIQERSSVITATYLLPWDGHWIVSRWLTRLQPDMVVIVETEIWPNLFKACNEKLIPLYIVNGRVYDRDVPRYRLAFRFFQNVLQYVSWIGVQSEAEREHFISIGASPDQIVVVGNTKIDASSPRPTSEDIDKRFTNVSMLIIGGSTHEPEERWLLSAFVTLRNDFHGLRLMLAPRHVQRFAQIERLLQQYNLRYTTWSNYDNAGDQWDVLLLDEIGWLANLYRYADIAVVGGSFANHGGHNFLEAAAHECAIVVGPYMQNFEGIVREFREADAIIQLTDHSELEPRLHELLSHDQQRTALGARAYMVLNAHRGAAKDYGEALNKRLESTGEHTKAVG